MMAQLRPLLVILAALFAAQRSSAEEKYWITHDVEIAVTGQLTHMWTIPTSTGWRITGTIVVERHLYGPPTGAAISYRFRCTCCRWWPLPNFGVLTQGKYLWLLKKSSGAWEPAGGCSDPGSRGAAEAPA